MYKKQLGFQKIVCLLAIVSAAVWFIYSLGMITDIHDALRFNVGNPNDRASETVAGAYLYYDMQPFNRSFQNVSIALILLGCLLYITNTPSRRKYYIGNYVATALYCIASVATVIWSHIHINAFKVQFLTTVDFAALKEMSEIFPNRLYTESTLMLDLHLVAAGLSILAVVGLIVNAVWKTRLMREENQLIESGLAKNGKEAAV